MSELPDPLTVGQLKALLEKSPVDLIVQIKLSDADFAEFKRDDGAVWLTAEVDNKSRETPAGHQVVLRIFGYAW